MNALTISNTAKLAVNSLQFKALLKEFKTKADIFEERRTALLTKRLVNGVIDCDPAKLEEIEKLHADIQEAMIEYNKYMK